MATRKTRLQGGASRTALLAVALLFLVPLPGIGGASGGAAASATEARGATAAAFGPHPYADGGDSGPDRARDGDRGCHEGENRAPREALPAPERTSSPTIGAAPASYEPRDDTPVLPGASPPDATSVDLYRTRVIRT
ncbi:hypothetical protein AB0Q95_37740 [Streptomyces sp. NPDC059900]|uniref:hypothetical protein n=1 Tax=Streptomyces sp. NPDC059900 TaxID=3155816 RepID=UPI00343AC4DB